MKTDQQVSSRAGHSRGHRAALSPAPALVNRSHGEGLPFRTGSCSLINTVWILRNLSPPCGAWGGGGWRAHDCLSFEAFPLLTGNLEGRSPALSQGPRSDGCCPPPPPQGDTPRQRAEKAQDTELAAYLENRQHYQMVQREDQETAV